MNICGPRSPPITRTSPKYTKKPSSTVSNPSSRSLKASSCGLGINTETVAQQKRVLLINQYIDEKNKKDATLKIPPWTSKTPTPTDGNTIREVALAETRKENKTLKTQVQRLTQQMRSIQKNLPSGAPPTKGSRQTKNGAKPTTGRKAAAAAKGASADNKTTRGKKKQMKPGNSRKSSKK
jgi:hypothetical protein